MTEEELLAATGEEPAETPRESLEDVMLATARVAAWKADHPECQDDFIEVLADAQRARRRSDAEQTKEQT